ncbi:MAG: hypothetical protein H6558_15955 [Lewinellaceae bacterium]|nr:hypothetical protein [Lewinellaceae bacterium]
MKNGFHDLIRRPQRLLSNDEAALAKKSHARKGAVGLEYYFYAIDGYF